MTRKNQPTKMEINKPKKDINTVIIRRFPEKSGVFPVSSLINNPDALKINKAAKETSKIMAVDIAVDFQNVLGNVQ